MTGRPGGNLIATLVAGGLGLALLVTFALWVSHPAERMEDFKEVIGKKDEIYYSHMATKYDARALGHALQAAGYLNDRGTSVLLSKDTAGTTVSFILNDGGWDHPDTVAGFEEIGRRVAASVGGFPMKVRLVNSALATRKVLTVGKVRMGARDEVYYFGTATEADALALGKALQQAGFLVDQGVSVTLSKGTGTIISFVVNDGVWEQPDAIAGVENLVRNVAPSVGGLPVKMRLLNAQMEPKKESSVQ